MRWLCYGFGYLCLLFMSYGQFIEVRNTVISVINRDYFHQYDQPNKIIKVSITNCSVREIEAGAFDELTSLVFLNLTKNSLRNVTFGANTLKYLILTDNYLTAPPRLEKFPNLLDLNLRGNNILVINYTGRHLEHHPLQNIDFSENELSVVYINLNKFSTKFYYFKKNPYSMKKYLYFNVKCPKPLSLDGTDGGFEGKLDGEFREKCNNYVYFISKFLVICMVFFMFLFIVLFMEELIFLIILLNCY